MNKRRKLVTFPPFVFIGTIRIKYCYLARFTDIRRFPPQSPRMLKGNCELETYYSALNRRALFHLP